MSAPRRILYQSFTDPDIDRPYFSRLTEAVRAAAGPGTIVEMRGLVPGDRYLHPLEEFRCAAQVIRNALAAPAEGFDAFVIGHFQEPGLLECRASLDIPVIGLGEASLLHACTLGRRIGLVTINPIFIPWHRAQVAGHGLESRVVEIAAIDGQVADFDAAFEDPALRRALVASFVAQLKPMVERQVEVLIPAGGLPMLLLGAERDLDLGGAVVLNGIEVAVKAAEMAVDLRRRSGLGPSRVSTYRRPPDGAVRNFLDHG